MTEPSTKMHEPEKAEGLPSEVSRVSEAPAPKVNLTPSSSAASAFSLVSNAGSSGNRQHSLLLVIHEQAHKTDQTVLPG